MMDGSWWSGFMDLMRKCRARDAGNKVLSQGIGGGILGLSLLLYSFSLPTKSS